ncbi:MAG: Tetratricopeptide 2 repeat protein, partial [Paucimonas sp.]|nr:Tetratricopeptide 2 repeat protein [Paucimonas sp.]
SLAALGVAALAMAAIGWMTVARVQGVVGMAYEPMSAHLFAQSSLPVSPGLSHALSIATQAGLYFRYLLVWLLPAPAWMAIDMRAEFLPGFGRWEAWAGPIAFAAYGVLATRLLFARGLAGLAGFGLLYPWLLYPLEFSSIRVQETFVLYRSYLWMPGLMLVLATLVVALQRFSLRRSLSMPGLRAALLVSCVLLLAPATVDRLQVASDGWRLWDDAARLLANDSVPGADRIRYNRANAALAAGRYREAVSDLQRVVAISPQLMPVHHALGNAYLANGQPGPAEQEFRLALSHSPANPALRYAWAISLKRTGREAEAREQMRVSCAGNYMPACMVTARLGKDAAPR